MLLIAGCAGVNIPETGVEELDSAVMSGTESSPPPDHRSDTASPETEPTDGTEEMASVEPVDPVHPDNPFGTEDLTVSLNHSIDDRDMTQVVQNSLNYWNEHSEEYAGYPVELRLEENATQPDIEIIFVTEIEFCGLHDNDTIMGCAPVNADSAPETSTVLIEAKYTAHTTEETIKHEIGHTLGLVHGDEPRDLMAEFVETGSLRSNPAVYVDRQVSYPHSVEREVDRALTYLEGGADGSVETPPSFTVVDDRSRADIIIEITANDTACGSSAYSSCADSDTDRSEYRDQYVIVLADVETETIGWNIVYNLIASYVEVYSEIPDDFAPDTDYNTRSGNWWR